MTHPPLKPMMTPLTLVSLLDDSLEHSRVEHHSLTVFLLIPPVYLVGPRQ